VGGKFYPVMHGAAIAAPIWKGIMNKVLEDAPMVKFTEPPAKYLANDPSSTSSTPPVVQGQLPPVVGRSITEVESALQAAGFQTTLGGTMASSAPIGTVAGISPYQSPPPGSLITIYTSRGSS
ncbi:MAG: Peptidoglycan glycosyltransferase, partial [Humibacillus sp.]|nr:Peptidoglycan glycosyltransferase [Humibacillus sp.]